MYVSDVGFWGQVRKRREGKSTTNDESLTDIKKLDWLSAKLKQNTMLTSPGVKVDTYRLQNLGRISISMIENGEKTLGHYN